MLLSKYVNIAGSSHPEKMVRNFEHKSNRRKYPQSSLTAAISDVKHGNSVRRAALVHRIPRETLARYVYQADPEQFQQLGSYANVFTAEQENEILGYVLSMEQTFYGITIRDLQQLAFDLAEKNQIHHPFNKSKGIAGLDWVTGFRKRHPQISLRVPEATSAARAQGFNRVAVGRFHDQLAEIMVSKNISPNRIYNVDETSVNPVGLSFFELWKQSFK